MDQFDESTVGQSGSQAVRILRQRIKDGTLSELVQDWKWILSFSRGRWGSIFLYTLLGILSSSIALGTSVVSKYLIDCIVTFDRSRLLPLAVLMVLSGVLSVAVRSLTSRFSAKLSVSMRNDVQRRVFDDLLAANWLESRQYAAGDLLNRFTGDVGTVAGCAVSWLPSVIIQIFTVLATLCVVMWYDPVMALIAFASTPVLIFASRRLLRRQRTYNMHMRQVSSTMSAFQAETFRNIDTLKSFGVEPEMSEKLRSLQEDYRKVVLEYNEFSIKTNILLTSLGTAVQYIALAYCLWQLWSGKILFGTMVLFLQQRTNLSMAFSALISLIPTALSGSVSAERIRELTQLRKEPRLGRHTVNAQGGCSVELQKVCASYEDKRQILKDVDFHVGIGQVVALVGPSGEGKSTLIRLLLGLMPTDSGQGFLEDSQGNRFPLGADTRHLFAYVPQGNTVLAGSIAENLLLVNHEATEAQMIEALKDACAWDFVSQLPKGIHSTVGEGGKGFSEGQAQRIAIARALVRRAPILLLDEVTSALDYGTERQVLNNLMRRGITCIVATHRPSVLASCSRVYRVSEGTLQPLTEDQIRHLTSLDN